MTFSQAREASRFHIVNQSAERTFIVFRILAAVETFATSSSLDGYLPLASSRSHGSVSVR
jgi:hypothetical protein